MPSLLNLVAYIISEASSLLFYAEFFYLSIVCQVFVIFVMKHLCRRAVGRLLCQFFPVVQRSVVFEVKRNNRRPLVIVARTLTYVLFIGVLE